MIESTSAASGSTTTPPAGDAPKNRLSSDALGRDAFLQLLVTQMSHQNPLQPQEDGAFIAQLAQFSSLEQLTNIDSTLKTMATAMGVELPKTTDKKKA